MWKSREIPRQLWLPEMMFQCFWEADHFLPYWQPYWQQPAHLETKDSEEGNFDQRQEPILAKQLTPLLPFPKIE